MRSPAPADMAPPCPCQHCGLSGTRDRRGDPACRMSLMSSSMSEGLCEYSFRGRHNGAHKISPLTSPLSGVPTVRRTDYHACSASVSRRSGYWVFATTNFSHI